MTTLWSTIISADLSSIVLIVLVLVILALCVLAAVVLQLATRLSHLATPVYDKAVREAEEKAERILAEAREQAETIRTKAQEEAEQIFENRKQEDEQFRLEQMKHIEAITAHANSLLDKQINIIPQLSEGMQKVFAEIGEKVKREYEALSAETKQRMQDELTKEVEATRQAVKAYKQERIEALNKEIVGLVEDTARITLNKSLSLSDHRDIVLNALAEAKQQGIFSALS